MHSDELDALLAAPDLIDDPYPIYKRLREEAPVFWSEHFNGWVITRYDDVVKTFMDSARFRNGGRFEPVFDALPAELHDEFAAMRHHFQHGVISADPPDHTRLRALIQKAFTPRAVDAMRDVAQRLVDARLDAVTSQGRMDVLHDLANPLPVAVIAQMMGVPASDAGQLKAWSDDTMRFQAGGRATPDVLRISKRALFEFRDYLKAIFALRRAEPRDDLISALVHAEEQGDRLSEEELLAMNHPDQLAALRANPGLIAPAIEECLRYDTSLQRNRRIVADDFEFGGQPLRKGQFVMQVIGAANRDPEVFPEPDRFDITRSPNPHIAFGRGIHFCLGAPLARIEAPIALNALIQRFPNLQLATDRPEWRREQGALRSLRALPVKW